MRLRLNVMKPGPPPGGTLAGCWAGKAIVGRRPVVMVHVGLDLSRTRLDVHVMDESGAPLAVTTALPEAGGLAALASRIGAQFGGPVYAAIESMNGARFSCTTSWRWRAGRSRSP